ncbi:MAG: DUF362 domain-containing protein [bacterium]
MTSRVYFGDAYSTLGNGLLRKLRKLCDAGLSGIVGVDEKVAVKVHWGERGNLAYLRPPYARLLVDMVREAGGRPFVTDTNVLYRAARHDAIGNLQAAAHNGFTAETVGAPLIVADGLTGRDGVDVVVTGGRRVQTARIASAIHGADAMLVLSHVKGHLLFGYGGALKNLGIGCATPAGKHVLHQDLKPTVDEPRCIGCRHCGKVCPEDAISYREAPPEHVVGKRLAHIDPERCIGCGECVAACPEEAIPIRWDTAQAPLVEKTAEYAWAAVANKPDKVGFVNIVMDVVPDCDCMDCTNPAIVGDIGFLVSTDPVAIDQASLDLINEAPLVPGAPQKAEPAGGDHIHRLYGRDYRGLLDHAEKIGLGSRDYELVRI